MSGALLLLVSQVASVCWCIMLYSVAYPDTKLSRLIDHQFNLGSRQGFEQSVAAFVDIYKGPC
jgi:hypothetical protein